MSTEVVSVLVLLAQSLGSDHHPRNFQKPITKSITIHKKSSGWTLELFSSTISSGYCFLDDY